MPGWFQTTLAQPTAHRSPSYVSLHLLESAHLAQLEIQDDVDHFRHKGIRANSLRPNSSLHSGESYQATLPLDLGQKVVDELLRSRRQLARKETQE